MDCRESVVIVAECDDGAGRGYGAVWRQDGGERAGAVGAECNEAGGVHRLRRGGGLAGEEEDAANGGAISDEENRAAGTFAGADGP